MTAVRALRVAVVGAGPSGFYAAEALLDHHEDARVDMFDRLATPWGLVRSGVAPDHPKIKSVSSQYEKTAARPGFRFFGHVELGVHVTREELLERYDAVVYAVGAQTERPLGLPGEDLPGSIASVDFVGWYNGHPHHADLAPPLDTERPVVIGAGNVALDVARMLLLPDDDLRVTDTADHALEALRSSSVREVVLCGRRGAAQASFTTTELRELEHIDGLGVEVDPKHVPAPDDPALADASKALKRDLDLMRGWTTPVDAEAVRARLRFRFLRSPVEIRGEGRVEEIVLAVNRLETGPDGRVRAVDTGERETVSTGLVLRAVGYRGVALDGVPFDEASGTVPHERGRVRGGDREYVTGWIKRGPTGIIGTNRKDAVETVHSLVEDLDPAIDRATDADIDAWLRERCPDLVDDAGWRAIDEHERSAGEREGRPRVKVIERGTLISLAAASASHAGSD